MQNYCQTLWPKLLKKKVSIKDILFVAQGLLARREHSKTELSKKLQTRGFEFSDIEGVIEQLNQQGLQSDARFAENCYRSRAKKGYGPNYIRQYLKQRGVCESLIDKAEYDCDVNWYDNIVGVWKKKYSDAPSDLKSINKQKQFLYYRGFDTELITHLFDEL